MPFPLGPRPSWYTRCSFPARNGIFYEGQAPAPTIILDKAGATAYTVRDYTGAVVSSGEVTGTTLTPAPPEGGWPLGWYRVYLTGPNTDAVFGPSYGATNFVVVPADARFPATPAPTVNGGRDYSHDYVTKGVLGIGTSRQSINVANAPTTGYLNLADADVNIALSTEWWENHGDGVRPREQWCNFPNRTWDSIALAGEGGGTWLDVYATTGELDPGLISVQLMAGSNASIKINVYYPDPGTLVESFDGLGTREDVITKINYRSQYIKVYAGNRNRPILGTGSPTKPGTTTFTDTFDQPDGPLNAVWQSSGEGTQSVVVAGGEAKNALAGWAIGFGTRDFGTTRGRLTVEADSVPSYGIIWHYVNPTNYCRLLPGNSVSVMRNGSLFFGDIEGWQTSAARAVEFDGNTVKLYDSAGALIVSGSLPDHQITSRHGFSLQEDKARVTGTSFATVEDNPDYVPNPAVTIGNAYRNGVKQVVSTLYPRVRWFEGPSNEPAIQDPVVAHWMRLFQGAVKAGNPNALAIGPCPVEIGAGSFDAFMANGGGQWCDGFAIHDYNSMTNGNIALGRTSIQAWVDVLAKYGMANKPRWQTEAGMAFKSVYGVYHPRRSLVQVLHTLLWEQYGVPAERNTPWYDISHGFWDFPTWLINGDSSLSPDAIMLRTLTAETWGRTYDSRLDFGRWGDAILLGNVYTGATGSTVVICASTEMPNQSVTLNVVGAAEDLTLVDTWGARGTVPVVGGKVTVPAPAHPVYLHLPVGATVSVRAISDWPEIGARGQDYNVALRGKAPSGLVIDGKWMPRYDGSGVGTYTTASVPAVFDLSWDRPQRFDRVLIWNAMSWQNGASLLDFDIQTSEDGTTWTTRATVSKTAESFKFGTDDSNAGCQYETYWDEQWIFDVKLPEAVTAPYLRLNVRSATHGGEPDAQAVVGGGQGGSPRLVLQEIAVLCDDNTRPRYAVRR